MQTLPDRQQNDINAHMCFVAATVCLRFLSKYARCFNLHGVWHSPNTLLTIVHDQVFRIITWKPTSRNRFPYHYLKTHVEKSLPISGTWACCDQPCGLSAVNLYQSCIIYDNYSQRQQTPWYKRNLTVKKTTGSNDGIQR